MEITQLEGLENFGNSEIVSDISDFLSLEELGHNIDEVSTDDINLTEVELNSKKLDKDKDVSNPIIPLEGEGEGEDSIVISTEDIDLEEDKNVKVAPTTLDYKSIVQELVEGGIWEPIGAFDTEDGEIAFEDMNIDKDTFVALMKHNQEELKEKLTSNSVSIEGVSDFTKKLISIEKHGGNVQKALQAYQTIKEPLETIDINDTKGQRAICYLRLQQNGITGEEATDLIDSYEIKGILEDKAIAFKSQLDEAFNNWVSQQEQAAIDEDRKYKESLKTYKASLNEVFKSSQEFKISETHRKKLLDIATKEREDGLFELDDLIDNHRRNPVDAAELLLFITDKESFIKAKAQKLLDEQNKKVFKTINIIPKSKTGVDLSNKSKKLDDVIIPLDNLK